ncbi:hypothetical protein PF011_g3956 [Phytophthora fragariae]|uniref:Uncharacterized protein n=1 Tax=Phytophthora fragariae TaxID=53985 RepID=A0A6A3LZ96_9STRA|nr:hypothetical protein PF011_g3956 [Phytophthora fragariae]
MAPAASNLVVKKKKKGDDDVDPVLKRIAALFQLEKSIQDGTLTPNDERCVQTEFWSTMTSILAVNELISGVEILNDIAAALFSGQADPITAFSGPITPPSSSLHLCASGPEVMLRCTPPSRPGRSFQAPWLGQLERRPSP